MSVPRPPRPLKDGVSAQVFGPLLLPNVDQGLVSQAAVHFQRAVRAGELGLHNQAEAVVIIGNTWNRSVRVQREPTADRPS